MSNIKFSNLDMPSPAEAELLAKELVIQHAGRTNQSSYVWTGLSVNEINYWKATAVVQIIYANWKTYFGI